MARRCSLDESVFDHPEDNPTAAFFVGLLLADGCISPRPLGIGSVSLGLSGEDGSLVYEFRDFLKSTHKITTKPNRHGFANAQPRTCFQVSSKRLVNALARFGVVRHKTAREEVFYLQDNEHFWAGVFCGDGWFSGDNKGHPALGLTGSYRICEQFLDFAKKRTHTQSTITKNGNIWCVRLGGKPAVDLTRILFPPDRIALSRKKEIAERIIQDALPSTRGGVFSKRFYEYKGEERSLVEWADLTGIPYFTLRARIEKYGFSIEQALSMPVKQNKSWKNLTRDELLALKEKHGSWTRVAISLGAKDHSCIGRARRRLGLL